MPDHPLRVVSRPEGLYAPGLDLYLDPTRPVPRAFVSHAHGDHAGSGPVGELYASRETAEIVRARFGVEVSRPLEWDAPAEIETPLGVASITVAPAGHTLGAAQLVADTPEGRLVYSGDYQSGPGLTHAAGAPIRCDVLVIESTFGLPIFRFPPREEVRARIVDWCDARLRAGESPVVLAYALGKGQELARALCDARIPVMAHGAIHKMAMVYERLGAPIPGLRPYDRADADPAVLLVPPRARTQPIVKKRKKAAIVYVSGWALVDAARERFDADAVFPLSDHADFDDLLEAVGASGAAKVYVTHGFAGPLASILRERGVDAAAIDAPAVDEREQSREEEGH